MVDMRVSTFSSWRRAAGRRFVWMLAYVAALLAAPLAQAVEAPERAKSERAEARLVADVAAAAPGRPFTVALQLKLAPHWHSYWRNPGASGLETKIIWDAPKGVEIGELQFPIPKRIPFGELVNFGFENEATHLVDVTPPKDWPVGAPLTLKAKASWLVCEKICVPEAQEFTLIVPTAATATRDLDAARIVARGRSTQPAKTGAPARFKRLEGAQYRIEVDSPSMARAGLKNFFFFPHDWRAAEASKPQKLERTARGVALIIDAAEAGFEAPLTGVLRAEYPSGAPVAIEVSATLMDGAKAVAIDDAPEAPAAPKAAPKEAPAPDMAFGLQASVGAATLLAFLGGLILNIMPCVFPVLALKAVAIARAAHADTTADAGAARHGLRDGLAYGAGVLASFLAFAAGLLALKSAGVAAGWGFQLQTPIVVAALAYVLVLVGLNLAGVFDVALGGGGVGQKLTEKGGVTGSFFTGVLAALVAAPCTAPFMGAALGFALTQDAATALIVFAALAIGFAAPIILLAAAPATARLIPKPGPWMERFRQALAFPMFLAAAWLFWVLGHQAGVDTLFSALIGAVALAFATWALGVAYPRSKAGRIAAVAGAVLALVGALWALSPAWSFDPSERVSTKASGPRMEAFSTARLAELRGKDQLVLLNVTADWCISCKVNELNVLRGDRFRQVLERTDAIYLKADWTLRDEKITKLLGEFGRVGVPLYVVYPRGGGEPIILPQILTHSALATALGDS
ncbi:MAG: thioredoxin family protein [Neomegalonema sp.]|nr:thioredoxin family protein [Neomegalonema sp.]